MTMESLGINTMDPEAEVTEHEMRALDKIRSQLIQAIVAWRPGDQESLQNMNNVREWVDLVNSFMVPRLCRDLRVARERIIELEHVAVVTRNPVYPRPE